MRIVLDTNGSSPLFATSCKGPLALLMPPPAHFPDPDDAVFVAVALVGAADAIVTGNTKHFAKVVRPLVYSPSDFLDLFGDTDPDES